jgi:5-dehydro-2-deoxygluconokinase
MRRAQEETVLRLADAARANELEFLLELIASKCGTVDDETTARLIQRFYDIGVRPDWWKLEPAVSDGEWEAICAAIRTNDPWCRGVVVLGFDAPEDALAESFAAAARHELVKGFAVGRTIFGAAARAWFAGDIDDEAAVVQMAARYGRLCDIWDRARQGTRGAP